MDSVSYLEIPLADAEATVALGKQLGEVLSGIKGLPVLFFGELGAGKTTLTRGLVSALPGGEDAEVSSPSFTLCNVYATVPSVLHCDLYRAEAVRIPDELEEAFDQEEGLVLVEWAERIGEKDLPAKRLDIHLAPCKNNRLAILTPHGEEACSVLRELARLRGVRS